MTTPESKVNRTIAVRARPDNSGTAGPGDTSGDAVPGPAAGLSAGETAQPRPPIVCDMTSAPDTGAERLAEYARLFESAYLGRDRDQAGSRWLLRAGPGVEEWARDLAERENACCAFMTSTVTREGDLVIWHMTAIDDETANAVLDLFHDLPLRRWSKPSQVEDALDLWSATRVPIITRGEDIARPATAEGNPRGTPLTPAEALLTNAPKTGFPLMARR
jgi:hypothetical protein